MGRLINIALLRILESCILDGRKGVCTTPRPNHPQLCESERMATEIIVKKQCTVCQKLQIMTEFPIINRTKTNPLGNRGTWCRSCLTEYNRKYRKKRISEDYPTPDTLERECSACEKTKPVSEFSPHRLGRGGIRPECKTCCAEKTRKWYRENTHIARMHYIRNRDRILERCKKYNKQNCHRALQRYKTRYRTDVGFCLRAKMSSGIRMSLKTGKNKTSWLALVPYTLDELKKHLIKTMPKGYTWDDFLSGELHIDHRIPVSKFNIKSASDIDFQRCWAKRNLRLLPSKENISKGAKLEKPFQPSFAGI